MNQLCKLHVLHVASGDLWAGAEVQLFTLAKTLDSRLKATVSVVILNPGRLEQELRKAGIRVIVLDEAKLNGLQILQQLLKTIRELKPDVIHTHRNKENILGSIAAKLNGIPSLRTAHGATEHNPGWQGIRKTLIRFLDWFCGKFLQRRIISVSEDLSGILGRKFHRDMIRTIENGIDVDTLVHSAKRSRARSSENKLRIGIVGRLVPVKRMDIFINTAKYINNTHPELPLDFLIYGDGPLRSELEALVHSLDAGCYVHFEGHRDDISAVLCNLDLLLMTSDHEGLPMVLLEAMALQTPIIAHRVGGITSLLDEGTCGILVEDHSPAGYARALREHVKNFELLEEFSTKAWQRVKTHYSAEQNARNYCAEYRRII